MHRAEVSHLLLALFLLFQQLFLSGNVAAVALGKHVLAHGLYRLPGDDPSADGGLYGHFKKLAGNVLLQLFTQPAGAGIRLILVGDKAQCVHSVAVQKKIHLHQFAAAIAGELIVQRSVAFGIGFERIKEIVDDLIEGHLIVQLHQPRIQILHVLKLAAAILAHGHDVAHVVLRCNNGNLYVRLLRVFDGAGIGIVVGIVHPHHGAVRLVNMVNYAGQRGDKIQIKLPFQPLLYDFHVKHAQKAATKAEPQRHRGFRLKGQ